MTTAVAPVEKFGPMMVDRRNDGKAYADGPQMSNSSVRREI
jgi:hypothetical protein